MSAGFNTKKAFRSSRRCPTRRKRADRCGMRIASQIAACLESTLAPGPPRSAQIVGDRMTYFAAGSRRPSLAAILALGGRETVKREVPKSVCGRVCYQCRSSEPIPPERGRL